MDNLIPVAISSVKNIVHPSSKEREKTVHMAIGRFLFDIGADFDAVSSVNFQPLVDAIVSGGFGVSLPANEDIKKKLVPEDNIQDIIGKDINSYKNAVGIFGRNLAIRARDTMLPERSELANVEDLIGGDMDNLIPVAISSVKNIVHPSSKEREKTVHMAIGRFLFDIGADFDAVSSVNFQPLVDAIVSGGFGVSLPANEDIKSWILKSCVEEAMVTSSEWNECSYSKEAGGLAMTETINDEKKLVPEDNIQDIIGKDINSYKNAVGIFGRNLAIRARDTMLPAEWWSTYGESCLNLSRFAIRLLSQTCSSLVGSGRILAPMEKVYESKNSIERQRLSDLVFVQYNMRLRRLGVESGDDNADPLSQSNMELLEDWVSRNQVCIEGNGSSDWKSLESLSCAH
ncbi:hypothetical protein F2Q69_00030730 [Brassica cretica]|uniref:HAT C-terminal dimerisation domain-containing protein n=1 Tax=Brassica cretica TaxID=69181 RepID=A0A8S9S8L4_BRACR|nr:hypothetical protein F2Q69_00030730 [Brassica cretica]